MHILSYWVYSQYVITSPYNFNTDKNEVKILPQ